MLTSIEFYLIDNMYIEFEKKKSERKTQNYIFVIGYVLTNMNCWFKKKYFFKKKIV